MFTSGIVTPWYMLLISSCVMTWNLRGKLTHQLQYETLKSTTNREWFLIPARWEQRSSARWSHGQEFKVMRKSERDRGCVCVPMYILPICKAEVSVSDSWRVCMSESVVFGLWLPKLQSLSSHRNKERNPKTKHDNCQQRLKHNTDRQTDNRWGISGKLKDFLQFWRRVNISPLIFQKMHWLHPHSLPKMSALKVCLFSRWFYFPDDHCGEYLSRL